MKTTETPIEDPHRDSEALPNPLERFVAGGWKRGIVRLLAGLAVIALVVSFTGAESIDRLLDPRLAPFLLLGAAVHLTQRVARIIKWARMIAPTTLVKHSMLYLLRIQFIGMMANLLLPLSEGLKVWAVSRTRAQAKVAAESIVAETALHALLVGVAGALGIVTVANRPSTLTITVAIMVSAPLLLLLAMKRWPRDQASRIAVVDGRVAGWCVIETSCQLAIYAITLHALGVDLTLSLLLGKASF